MGYRVKQIPIDFHRRRYGESRLISNVGTYAWDALSLMIKVYRNFHPLRFFGSVGFVLMLTATTLGGYVVSEWLTTGVLMATGKALLSVLLMTAGIQLVLFAFLADMIKESTERRRT
jgi:hypothetical protein